MHDDTPLRVIRFQYVTFTIIIINVCVFLLTGAFASEAVQGSIAQGFGLVPREFLGSVLGFGGAGPIPEPLSLVTSLFLHGGWLHLIGNMLFMWVFADNVEDAFGYAGFALFYVLCGALGNLSHVVMMPSSTQPLIGASGAVSGVLASYLVLYPRARVWVLLFMRIPVPLPALWVLGGWFLLQIYGLFSVQQGQEIAFWAHIGGFMVGLALTLLLRDRLFMAARRRN